MQRVSLNKPKSAPHFIGSWIINSSSLCGDLIDYFELNTEKQAKGVTSQGRNTSLESKKSIDITLSPKEINLPGNEVFVEYFQSLFDCHKDYIKQWPFVEKFAGKIEIGKFVLVRYQSGGHFQNLHTERSDLGTLHRVLVWMTYLNDVKDGGATYFDHYGLEVQPKQGLTLIWPAEWTHAHKGNVIQSGSKYIITGWMHFPE